ncbi:FAD/NAD(P)-binding protein [Streptomyces sp. NBC_00439]|uniref:FAD/NAD(P)-binding protein n=1 Tax=unclassified Streptomyces TaxID=2593676 RepID=UPI002258375E|nr:FAD/NAD(P)-binding protein [Streptomyces sp. NBC_00439]MCX5103588.1 FAD/NAD(P)-binding protein [Streptomyces sp. NBC_00439]WSX06261.1 FAD/NAD(P)-binding protein [Streptomyces sp. NBC_00987]
MAIVGAGAAAIALLAALSAQLAGSRRRVSVCVVDTVRLPGTGGVFQEDLQSILLNTQAGEISLVVGEPLHFSRWLAQRNASSVTAEQGTYAPRAEFGRYLHHVYTDIRDTRDGLDVAHVADRVDRVRHDGDSWLLRLRHGATLRARLVVVAIGPGTPADHYGLAGHAHYVHQPFPLLRNLAAVPPRSRVLVVGSQLSAVDAVIGLSESGHTGPVTLASRRGLLPLVKAGSSVRPQDADLRFFQDYHRRHGELPLRVVARCVRKRLGEQGTCLHEYLRMPAPRNAVEFFGNNVEAARRDDPSARVVEPSMVEALSMLSAEDMALFMRIGYPVLMYKHTAIPLVNAERILRRIRAGKLALRGGLRAVVPAAERFAADFGSGARERFDVVVNATGAARSICGPSARAPFTGLCRDALVKETATGGARVTAEGQLIPAVGEPSGGLYILGHASIGTHPFINSLSMISLLAGRMARSVLRNLADVRSTGFTEEVAGR